MAKAGDLAWGWALSEHTEDWHHADTREEAIAEARATAGPGKPVWILPAAFANPATFLPDVARFIEDMEEAALENGCPDEIEEPFIYSDGAEAALEKALEGWARKYVSPNFWVGTGETERIDP